MFLKISLLPLAHYFIRTTRARLRASDFSLYIILITLKNNEYHIRVRAHIICVCTCTHMHVLLRCKSSTLLQSTVKFIVLRRGTPVSRSLRGMLFNTKCIVSYVKHTVINKLLLTV